MMKEDATMGYYAITLQLALVFGLAAGLFARATRAGAWLLQAEPNPSPDPAKWTALRRNAVSWTQRTGA
jgi:hypothetical protein